MTLVAGMMLAGLLVLAGLSFFFAAAESSLFALGKWRARQLAGESPERGATVARLLESPQDLLATIVLGNTFTNAGMVALVMVQALRGEWHMFAALGSLLVITLFGCEVAPKTLAVRLPERWALAVARPMAILVRFTRPLREVAQRLNTGILKVVVPESFKPHTGMTEDEYQELLEMAHQQGTLAESEKEIILQIISLHRRTAKDVMRPRAQMACIPDDLSLEEMAAAARQHKHRRLPLYDETPDTIVGVLNTRTLLLNPDQDLAEAVEFPSFVPESMNLLQLLKSLQRRQRGLAIVLDEFEGTAGLVTMEDILEAMVGRIRSEGEAEGFVMEKLGEGRWRVNGTMRLEDFRREYPALGAVPGIDTMGGLLVSQLGVVPAVGESVVFRGARLTANQADERRVRELLVEALKK